MDCFYFIQQLRYILCGLICLSLVSAQQIQGLQSLRLGHSLSPERNQTVLQSPDGTFSAGFYAVGANAYGFAIWYSHTPFPQTVVWMANREHPVNGKASRLCLQKDGDFVLSDADGSVVWTTSTKGLGVKEAELLPVGNLVLRAGSSGKIIWQSFDWPTDTLLPHQVFTKDGQLVSRMGSRSFRLGYYRLYFNDDNCLGLIYEGLNVSSKYWPDPEQYPIDIGRNIYNISRVAALDEFGGFSSSDEFSFTAWDYGEGPLRRLTLDIDGNLRLYSLNSQNNSWKISWVALSRQCRVHGLCGMNAICTYRPEPVCVCPPGFERVDVNDWFKGCRLLNNYPCNSNRIKFLRLPYADYYGFDFFKRDGISVEACEKMCLDRCDCLGFGYRVSGTGVCYPKFYLISGFQNPEAPNHMYIKIAINDSSVTNVSSLLPSALGSSSCSLHAESQVLEPNISSTVRKKGQTSQLVISAVSFVSALGLTEIVCIALGWWFFIKVFHEAAAYNQQGYFVIPGGLKRFRFSELKRATENFRESVGKGRFGSVYKGFLLPENKVVAVKRLEGVSQGEDEFRAELNMISRVNHMNLVRMFGYCAEGKHRLLVYEYIENGSLEKYLFTQDSSRVLDWNTRFQIAVGTARGLAYLHEECLEWILHCDIKPENILLDEEFRAKVSDFGMAKLVDSGHGNDRNCNGLPFSTIRGTRGYLAPEWTMNLPISSKADVYSFGILLLELVSGRKAADFNMSGTNFVEWAFDSVRERRWTENMVDPKLGPREVEWKSMVEIERVLKTALLCIDEDKDERPSMSQVVEMLNPAEGGDGKEIELSQIFRQTREMSDFTESSSTCTWAYESTQAFPLMKSGSL
ncbi:hypothetical protein SUGI_0009300 [Cryptomeria japonica]|nr:hypothetical protein SUGI_0009300 [Cryptomeria japonica]